MTTAIIFWSKPMKQIESDFGGSEGESNPQSFEDRPDLKSGVKDHSDRSEPY